MWFWTECSHLIGSERLYIPHSRTLFRPSFKVFSQISVKIREMAVAYYEIIRTSSFLQAEGSSASERQRPSSVPISHSSANTSQCHSSSSSPGLSLINHILVFKNLLKLWKNFWIKMLATVTSIIIYCTVLTWEEWLQLSDTHSSVQFVRSIFLKNNP